MPDFTPTINSAGVRKWRKRKIGICDYGAAGITLPVDEKALFQTTGLPIDWPTGVKDLGYLTTDGTTTARSVSANSTTMLQSLLPVRSDLESVEDSFTGTFGEANAWVKALWHLLPVASWPTDRDKAYGFAVGAISDLPYYTLWELSADGVGSQAIYRHRVLPKVRITGITDVAMNASDPETYGFTFGIYLDEVSGKAQIEGQDGPAYTTHIGTAV